MTKITDIKSRLIYNSRGSETIEVDVHVGDIIGTASSPAGASVGKFEAVSFRNSQCKDTIDYLDEYKSHLIGADSSDIFTLKNILKDADKTDNYSSIGGSAAYAISLASIDVASQILDKPIYEILLNGKPAEMPLPLGNVLGGGMHAGNGSTDIQEFLSYPLGADSIHSGIQANLLVHKEIKKIIDKKDSKFSGGKGDEGAWAPQLSNTEALEVAQEAINTVSDAVGFEIRLGLDVASSSLWVPDKELYVYSRENKSRNTEEQISYVLELIEKYNLIYVEDPLHEEAFSDFTELSSKNDNCLIVGDDLFVTNTSILQKGIDQNAGNAVILKVNQAGALGDAMEFANSCNQNNYAIIASHRSGDTIDPHLAHIAIGSGSVMMKSGVVGGERISKLNELLRIEETNFINNNMSMPIARVKKYVS
uniref:Enolase n=1 Tax=uncultured marine thaumarchaeote AD1000_17_C04 TaxID=1455895 RepID=A0A075FL09_9ARCH|nr:phosphopyruvate hydratase (eno) [uncultured marine thaumarchaeote AD1000_17_C04]